MRLRWIISVFVVCLAVLGSAAWMPVQSPEAKTDLVTHLPKKDKTETNKSEIEGSSMIGHNLNASDGYDATKTLNPPLKERHTYKQSYQARNL